jgi:hypothetical protein
MIRLLIVHTLWPGCFRISLFVLLRWTGGIRGGAAAGRRMR